MTERDIFDRLRLPPELTLYLDSTNPWWEGKPGRILPQFKRWAFQTLLSRLQKGLAPVTVLRGPRQVGKTTLQEQIIDHMIRVERIDPKRILRVQFDEIQSLSGIRDPILAIGHWYENRVLGQTFNESAHDNRQAFLFFDEVQNLPRWPEQIKSLVDTSTVRVFVTGSSALRIEMGRDSLAGRLHTLEIGPLLLREIAGLRLNQTLDAFHTQNGHGALTEIDFWQSLQESSLVNREPRDRAFRFFAELGGYPMPHANHERPWPELADHLNETVIKRVLEHDLRAGEAGRKRDPALLEAVFRLCCRYTGQSPSTAIFVSEMRSIHGATVPAQRILSYLRFLDTGMLIRSVQPLELRLKKHRGPAKICLCDHSLRASWLQESIPLDPDALLKCPEMAPLAGHIAEGIVGFFLGNTPGLDLAHFPERGSEPEVDFIITVGDRRIPVEVKYQQRIDAHRDTLGLRSFIERAINNAPFGILVTMRDDVEIPDPRIVTLSLPSLLMMR